MNKKQSKILKKGLIFIAVLVGAGLLYYQSAVRLDIVSDEEMIARFNENRAEIEELVRRYRFYEPPEGKPHYKGFMEQVGTAEMMERIGIDRIVYRSPNWYPEPYSLEAAQERFAEVVANKRGLEDSYRYGTIKIEFLPDERYGFIQPLYGMIWKGLIYIPERPKIENGLLIQPINTDGSYVGHIPLLTSLDRIPSEWNRQDRNKNNCAYRQLEDHWFLALCYY